MVIGLVIAMMTQYGCASLPLASLATSAAGYLGGGKGVNINVMSNNNFGNCPCTTGTK